MANLARAEELSKQCEAFVKATHGQRVLEATTRRDTEFAKADWAKEAILGDALKARDEKIRDAEGDASRRTAEATARRDQILRQAKETEQHRGEEIVSQHAADLAATEATHKKAIDEAETNRRTAWQSRADAWSGGMQRVMDRANAIHLAMDERYPDWSQSGLPKWRPQDVLPEAIRIGEVDIALDRIPNGVSDDPRLRAMAPDAVRLPALLDFPEKSSIAFEFSGEEARKHAVDAMQAVMLRFATGLPAAKVRFTILDPVGLGRSFAGFMHLADYAEALVNTRIWTEPQQIDQRLAELNVHIETVIQNYLRNEFPTIEAYNAQAAEVAEPYRVLVVSDFPAGFSEPTAKRLAAIVKSGPRCGVYLILGLDTSQPLPPSITRDDLMKTAVRVTWRDGRFVLRDPVFETFPFPDR